MEKDEDKNKPLLPLIIDLNKISENLLELGVYS
jgi:hypothetical protein